MHNITHFFSSPFKKRLKIRKSEASGIGTRRPIEGHGILFSQNGVMISQMESHQAMGGGAP